LKPEEKVAVTVMRNNKEEKLTASLGKRAGAQNLFNSPEFNFEELNMDMENLGRNGSLTMAGRPRLGIKAQDTEEGKGVKVLEVDDESNAEKAGIEEGDIIVEFDGKPVNSATELSTAAREAREKNPIKVKLTRDGKSHDIEIKIPKKLKTANL
jgi:serine protease Do